jgi:hypothetical protein
MPALDCVSEFRIKKVSVSKYYKLSNTEFVNFALPSCIIIIVQPRQVLFSATNIGIVALNPTLGTEVGPDFRAFVLSCLARKPKTGRSPAKVSYQLAKHFTISKWIMICIISDCLIHKQGCANHERLNFVPWCLILMCPRRGMLSCHPSGN